VFCGCVYACSNPFTSDGELTPKVAFPMDFITQSPQTAISVTAIGLHLFATIWNKSGVPEDDFFSGRVGSPQREGANFREDRTVQCNV